MRKIGLVSGPGRYVKITFSEIILAIGTILLGGVMIGESLKHN